ncbi:MAG: hypothetical protein ACK46L_01890, partial [Synechococcaceae cyanobacterium]
MGDGLRARGDEPRRPQRQPAGRRQEADQCGLRVDDPAAAAGEQPFAIHRSLERRRERLQSRLKEERILLEGRSAESRLQLDAKYQPGGLSGAEIDDLYEEDTAGEIERTEEAFTDNATTAQTLAELEFEIQTLKQLEPLSRSARRSCRSVVMASSHRWN